MTNSIGDLTPTERKEVFKDYLTYYDLVWQHGNVKVCKDRQVTEKARRVLLSETDPVERFTTFDFYQTAFECVSVGVRDCRSVFNVFIKAAEVLEILCVNLFLFPWKKEIKTIKTFTGPFVYCIQPVLPKNIVRSILDSIGYFPESDTEYRLTPGANHDKAKTMGFELFLARVECEYLLEVMGQRAHAECLEILQRRAGPLSHRESHATAEDEPGSDSARAGKDSSGLEVDEVNLPVPDNLSLAEPAVVAQAQEEPSEGSVRPTGEPELHEPLRLEAEAPAVAGSPEPSGRHPAGSFMSDDRSMLEMQENYPDLAIRQKLIFRKNRGGSYPTPGTKARGRLGDDADIVPARIYAQTHTHPHASTSDLSGPQSFSVHTEILMPPGPMGPIKPLPKASHTDDTLDPQPLMVSSGPASMIQYRDTAPQSAVHRQGQQGTVNPPDLVQELNNRLSQLCINEMRVDEPLKYPIEETAQVQPSCAGCHDHHRPGAVTATAPPPGSPGDNSHQPILCSPSPMPVCSITGCSSCASLDVAHHGLRAGEDTIKEPPGSIYMPPSPLGMCGPPLEPSSGHLAAAAPPPLGQPGMEGRGSGQQPEDDLLKTYVLVEHERK